MQPQVRIGPGGVIGDPHIGDDHCVDTDRRGGVDRGAPNVELAGRRERIDCKQELRIPGTRIAERLLDLRRSEIQTRKIAGVRYVLETAIDRVCASIDGGTQGGRGSGRADELGAMIVFHIHHGIISSVPSATMTELASPEWSVDRSYQPRSPARYLR